MSRPGSRRRRRAACRCRTSADGLYVVASGTGRYRIDDTEVAIGPGDLLFAAAHAPHGFIERSDDYAEWIVLYGLGEMTRATSIGSGSRSNLGAGRGLDAARAGMPRTPMSRAHIAEVEAARPQTGIARELFAAYSADRDGRMWTHLTVGSLCDFGDFLDRDRGQDCWRREEFQSPTR